MVQNIETKEYAGLPLTRRGDNWLIDSRTVSDRCEIEHRALRQLVERHKSIIEDRFGVVAFEMEKPHEQRLSGGRSQNVYFFDEDQVTFVITMCKNTPVVVQFKAALVKAFSEAKKALNEQWRASLPNFDDPIAAAEAWIEERRGRLKEQEANKRLLPDAQFGREVKDCDGLMTVTQVAKALNIRSGTALYDFLKAEHVLFRQSGTWMARSEYVERKLFRMVTHTFEDATTGEKRSSQTLKVTSEGRAFIHDRWRKRHALANN